MWIRFKWIFVGRAVEAHERWLREQEARVDGDESWTGEHSEEHQNATSTHRKTHQRHTPCQTIIRIIAVAIITILHKLWRRLIEITYTKTRFHLGIITKIGWPFARDDIHQQQQKYKLITWERIINQRWWTGINLSFIEWELKQRDKDSRCRINGEKSISKVVNY